MKLVHKDEHNELILDKFDVVPFSLTNELREVEQKFYKIFDFNPNPMSINDMDTGNIIDVNQSFLDVMGFKCKYDVIGKTLDQKGFNLLEKRGKDKFIKELKNKKEVRNISMTFKNMLNKKIKGLFSGTIIELNDKQCMLIICQIINSKCIKEYLLNYFV